MSQPYITSTVNEQKPPSCTTPMPGQIRIPDSYNREHPLGHPFWGWLVAFLNKITTRKKCFVKLNQFSFVSIIQLIFLKLCQSLAVIDSNVFQFLESLSFLLMNLDIDTLRFELTEKLVDGLRVLSSVVLIPIKNFVFYANDTY